MNIRNIGILLKKDLVQHFRNQMIQAISIVFMVVFLAVYFLMPKTLDDNFVLGITATPIPELLQYLADEEDDFQLILISNEAELIKMIEEKTIQAGYLFPKGWKEAAAAGKYPEVRVYSPSDSTPELIGLLNMIAIETAWAEEGVNLLHINWEEEIMGPDVIGTPIPYRERMRSLIVLFALVTEFFGLAALINKEASQRTVDALLLTPLGIPEIFLSKAILGSGLAFIQSALMMAVIGGLANHPLLILFFILEGAVMVTSLSFLIGSLGRNFLSTMIWGVPVLILLILPGMMVIIPGAVADWVKGVPTYFLADSLFSISQWGTGWGENGMNLLILTAINIVFALAGMAVMKRRFR